MEKVEEPLLIFDGDCAFCRKWVLYWQSLANGQFEIAPSQAVAARFPEIPPAEFENAVYFVEPGGKVTRAAEAVFRSLSYSPAQKSWRWLYENLPGFDKISEWLYALVAKNRVFFSRLTYFFWGDRLERPSYFLTRWIFLRGLGVVYLVAFLSLGTQILGLIGSHGILPLQGFLSTVSGQIGPERFWFLPTLTWFNASDWFLNFLCVGGAVLSILAILNIAPALVFFLLWVFYLSILSVGHDFLSFQWDVLLLETGFLAIFFSPLHLLPKKFEASRPSLLALFLLRLLLFRLMFSSGAVKLLSGDLSWRDLTALQYHYETQPLPTFIGWFAHQLPAWFQKLSVIGMFGIELLIPFLIFTPRRVRFVAFVVLSTFQGFIGATGNYAFFNLLASVLCLTLLEDGFFIQFPPFRKAVQGIKPSPCPWPRWVIVPVTGVVLFLSVVTMSNLNRDFRWPRAVRQTAQWFEPLHLVSGYGLFAVMTTSRAEIVLEGSFDGTTWIPYEFKYKPGDLRKIPGFVAPHQPRLDWQMWFAALSSYRQNPWFVNLIIRLLQGSPEVLQLLKENPFPQKPPRYIQAVAYDYHFTNLKTLRETGAWWRREYRGVYLPPISLEQVKSS